MLNGYHNRTIGVQGDAFGRQALYQFTPLTAGSITPAAKAELDNMFEELKSLFPYELDANGNLATAQGRVGIAGPAASAAQYPPVQGNRVVVHGGAPFWFTDWDHIHPHVLELLLGLIESMQANVAAV